MNFGLDLYSDIFLRDPVSYTDSRLRGKRLSVRFWQEGFAKVCFHASSQGGLEGRLDF